MNYGILRRLPFIMLLAAVLAFAGCKAAQETEEGGEQEEEGAGGEEKESGEGEKAAEKADGDDEKQGATASDVDKSAEEGEVATPALPEIEIPFETFKLNNGLTVVVHEDPKTPVVAVNVWYHVGSKNEPEGRTGFAHLFEHLMFQGSENYQGEYFEPFQKVGATDMNGTTNKDRTNYFQNVPTPALDMALWMESDRMGHFQGAITQELLDEQRGVVQNEKRQGLNQPYGEVWELVPEYTYPKGHPYAHSVIGSMDDLNAATLNDVKNWFKTWYGPSNAVVVLAGDITVEKAKEKMEKYFGDIAPGPGLTRPDVWVAPMKEPTRLAMKDEVPQARMYKVWNVPEWGSPAERHLDLITNVLAAGKNSRLYKRLVFEDELATEVSAWISSGEIGSQVWIIATARPGVELAKVEAAVDEEMQTLLEEGVSDEELARAKMQHFSGKVYGAERVGGFGGKSDVLARSQVYGGSPDAWVKAGELTRKATADELKETANKWLGKGVFTVEVHPEADFDAEKMATDTPKRNASPMEGGPESAPMLKVSREPGLKAATEGADRSKLPETGTPPDLVLPELERTTLSNGLEVVLAQRSTAPVVRMNLQMDIGYAADPTDAPGTANMVFQMLDEGTESMDALAISARQEDLGASIGAGSSLDTSFVRLGALSSTLDPALKLFADVVKNPAFPRSELEKLRKRMLARIQQEKSRPVQTALRLLGPIIFGDDHAYGVPLTGSGTEESVEALTRDDLVKFHQTWVRPDKATLIVVGDVDMDTLKPKLEAAFGDWKAPEGDAPEKALSDVDNPEAAKIYLVNKPNAEQSVIIGGLIAPPRKELDIPLELANGVLGGQFTSRLNMNLREDKHWSYGSYSFIVSSQNQRIMAAYAAVQTDKTSESLAEMQKELTQLISTKPPTDEELKRLQDNLTLKLPGENETTAELMGNISEIVEYGLPDDYWESYVTEVRSTGLDTVSETAKNVVTPENMAWIVVGDLNQIQEKVTALKMGEVEVLESDSNEEDSKVLKEPPGKEGTTPKDQAAKDEPAEGGSTAE